MSEPMTNEDPHGHELRYFPNADSGPVSVVRDPQKFTVRFGAAREPLLRETQDLLEQRAARVDHLPEHRISVYSVSPAEAKQAVRLLNAERSVNLAAPVLHRAAGSRDDIYVTDHFVVQFLSGVPRERIDRLNAEHGVTVVEELGYAANGFLLAAPAGRDGLGALHMANIYRASGLTRFAHPDLIMPRHPRRRSAPPASSLKTAPKAGTSALAMRDAGYVSRQWHLAAAGVLDAWSLTYGDPRISIAVLDDGVDIAHQEFAGKVGAQFDFAVDRPDATPKTDFNNHGTACSGVAAARGLRVAGVAPECTLMPVRLPAFLGAADEARMFQWAADNGADVISCSWGPGDGTGLEDPLPGSTEAALAYCAHQGRGGKGIPICWAAGNGNESVDLDGYAASAHVIAISASTDRERRAWYSDHGDAIWVCAPSSGAASLGEKAIITTDRTGSDGYNDGAEGIDRNYTNSFGGTSSAAPLVAGVVGLMLSANPDLTAMEVRQTLKDTARRIGDGYDVNGHSSEYGYGQVDAYAAVQAVRQATETPADRPPSIAGPAEVSRSGPTPEFNLQLRHGAQQLYYAVEVATAAWLFDSAGHGAERSVSNFYASWQDLPFLGDDRYRLPPAVWQQLRHADALFYRAWFSASPTQWVQAATTTKDSAFATAPSMAIESGCEVRKVPVTRSVGDDRTFLPTAQASTRAVDPDEFRWRRL